VFGLPTAAFEELQTNTGKQNGQHHTSNPVEFKCADSNSLAFSRAKQKFQ
jgi:hypothetical protein